MREEVPGKEGERRVEGMKTGGVGGGGREKKQMKTRAAKHKLKPHRRGMR